MRILLGVLLLAFSPMLVIGQHNCAFDKLHKLGTNHSIPAEVEDFFEFAKSVKNTVQSRTNVTYKIPVVFHIVHQGEAVGTGTNLSSEKVLQQLSIINEDFNALNGDVSQTPANFASVIGSTNIQFCLAQTNPDGAFEEGIQRHYYPEVPNTDFVEDSIKPATTWEPAKYLNIWVVRIPEIQTIGYSYLPTSSVVGRALDGVVIQTDYFSVNPMTGSMGRTLTHELGHYFGLVHPWGTELSCEKDDMIDDTPLCDEPTYGCPSGEQAGCEGPKLHNNFMEYVNDNCMHMFTEGQTALMRMVLPSRRAELIEHGELLCNTIEDCSFEITEKFQTETNTWKKENASNNTGWLFTPPTTENNNFGSMQFVSGSAKESYLFTPCLEVEKGITYEFTYITNTDNNTPQIGFSAQHSSADIFPLSTLGAVQSVEQVEDYFLVKHSFTASLSMNFHIALYSNASVPFYIDDMQLRVFDEYGPIGEDDIETEDDIVLDGTTPNQDQRNIRISLFPNPTTQAINFKLDVNNLIQYEVYNTNGSLAKKGDLPAHDTHQINVIELPQGVYFLKIIDKNDTFIGRFIKQ